MSQQPPVVSRRTFTKLGATAAAAFGLSEPMRAAQARNPAAHPDGETLKSELLFLIRFETGNPSGLGGAPAGVPGRPRGTLDIVSGVFEGPKVAGRVIPPSAEYSSGGPDAHLTLVTDDDQRIYMHYQAFSVSSPGEQPPVFSATSGVGGKVGNGAQTLYSVGNPWFEAGTGKYAWMNNIVAVSLAFVPPYRFINYRVYQIL